MQEPHDIAKNDKSTFGLKEWDRLLYPVVKRRRGTSVIDECPFCGKRHTHGMGNGHRLPHCKENSYFEKIIIKGNVLSHHEGYFIEEY